MRNVIQYEVICDINNNLQHILHQQKVIKYYFKIIIRFISVPVKLICHNIEFKMAKRFMCNLNPSFSAQNEPHWLFI